MALSRQSDRAHECPLSGVKRACLIAARMSAFDPKRTSQRAVSSAVTKGCPRAVLRLHLLVSIDKKMIEILNANESEPRVFHVGERVKGDGQSRGKNEHVNPAARFGSGHTEASK
jgi:hypothetical protein